MTSSLEPEKSKLTAYGRDTGESRLEQQMLQRLLQLPLEAYTALSNIEKHGSPEDLEELLYKITRALLSVQYDIAHRQVMAEMNSETIEQLHTEEDITNLAISLTND